MNVKFPGGSDKSLLHERLRASSDRGNELFSKHFVTPSQSLTTTSKSITSVPFSRWSDDGESCSQSSGIVALESTDLGDRMTLTVEFDLLSVV